MRNQAQLKLDTKHHQVLGIVWDIKIHIKHEFKSFQSLLHQSTDVISTVTETFLVLHIHWERSVGTVSRLVLSRYNDTDLKYRYRPSTFPDQSSISWRSQANVVFSVARTPRKMSNSYFDRNFHEGLVTNNFSLRQPESSLLAGRNDKSCLRKDRPQTRRPAKAIFFTCPTSDSCMISDLSTSVFRKQKF